MQRSKQNNKLAVGLTLIVGMALWASACLAADDQGGSTPVNQRGKDSVDRVTSGGPPALQRRNPRYRLETGDVIELVFPLSPEFNQTTTVQPDGYINLLSVGDLHVEGQTTPELTQRLRDVYSKILHEPAITVQLKEFEKPYFVAAGEVVRPGKYDLHGLTTATQAVALAGGFTQDAKHSQVLLFRRASNDWVEVKKLNIKKMLQAANLGEDVMLQPGDMLFAPKSTIGKIRGYIPRSTVGMYTRPFAPLGY